MPTCSHCGGTVSEDAVYCGNCKAALDPAATSLSTFQTQATPKGVQSSSNESGCNEMAARLEKAMRRTELLSYAVVGLGVALLAIIIGISVL